MAHPLSYREYPPPADLAGWLSCFWHIDGTVGDCEGFSHRVLPDGCADLLFDLRGTFGRAAVQGEIVGPMSRGEVVELRSGVDLLGVRLRPGATAAVLGIAADQLLDLTLPISEAPVPLRVDTEQLAGVPDTTGRIELLTAACRARLAALDDFDPIVHAALARWALPARGFPTISILVRDLGLSERAFERRFVANVGLTPVRFRRLARLRSVLRLFSEGGRDWAAMAAATGFADQSHLVRDFQSFIGLSPTRWAATQTANAGFVQDGRITAL